MIGKRTLVPLSPRMLFVLSALNRRGAWTPDASWHYDSRTTMTLILLALVGEGLVDRSGSAVPVYTINDKGRQLLAKRGQPE